MGDAFRCDGCGEFYEDTPSMTVESRYLPYSSRATLCKPCAVNVGEYISVGLEFDKQARIDIIQDNSIEHPYLTKHSPFESEYPDEKTRTKDTGQGASNLDMEAVKANWEKEAQCQECGTIVEDYHERPRPCPQCGS